MLRVIKLNLERSSAVVGLVQLGCHSLNLSCGEHACVKKETVVAFKYWRFLAASEHQAGQ